MQAVAEPPKLLTELDVARAIRLRSEEAVRKAVDRGEIPPPITIGRRRLWPAGVIREFVETGRFSRPAEAITA